MSTDHEHQVPHTPPPAEAPAAATPPVEAVAPSPPGTPRASWLTTGVIAAVFALGGVAVGTHWGSDGTVATVDPAAAVGQLPQGQFGQGQQGQQGQGQLGPGQQGQQGQGQLGQGPGAQGQTGPAGGVGGPGVGRPGAQGTVTARDGSTLTVEATDPITGETSMMTVEITDDTRIEGFVDGTPTVLSLDDVAEGDTVHVIGEADGDTVVAVALLVGDGPAIGAGPGGGSGAGRGGAPGDPGLDPGLGGGGAAQGA